MSKPINAPMGAQKGGGMVLLKILSLFWFVMAAFLGLLGIEQFANLRTLTGYLFMLTYLIPLTLLQCYWVIKIDSKSKQLN